MRSPILVKNSSLQGIFVIFVSISGKKNHAVLLNEFPDYLIRCLKRKRYLGEGDNPENREPNPTLRHKSTLK